MIVVSQLRSALDGIRDKFFTIDEFPYIDRSRFPMGVCEAAMQVKEEDLDSYCASLSGKQLEAMIRDLTELETEEEREGHIDTDDTTQHDHRHILAHDAQIAHDMGHGAGIHAS